MKTSISLRSVIAAIFCVSTLATLPACSSGKSRPTFDEVKAPDTKDELKGKPKGLRPDNENAVHTNESFPVE